MLLTSCAVRGGEVLQSGRARTGLIASGCCPLDQGQMTSRPHMRAAGATHDFPPGKGSCIFRIVALSRCLWLVGVRADFEMNHAG